MGAQEEISDLCCKEKGPVPAQLCPVKAEIFEKLKLAIRGCQITVFIILLDFGAKLFRKCSGRQVWRPRWARSWRGTTGIGRYRRFRGGQCWFWRRGGGGCGGGCRTRKGGQNQHRE